MPYIYSIIKADYLQRTRSYAFLITLAVTVYVAYLFVPPTSASYTTLSTVGFKSVYNSAWVGYISATMTAVMLSFYGFLLVNNSIRRDIDTEVGLIIAAMPVSNFKYLLGKQLSNYAVLCTIAGCTFVVSILMFLVRGAGYPFVLAHFVLPYLFFVLPAMFLVASLAVVAEVFLGKRSILQFILYFFLCGACMAAINKPGNHLSSGIFDPFGLSLVTSSVKNQVNAQYHQHIEQVSFGFIFNKRQPFKTFVWNGISWTSLFVFSRLLWMSFALGLVYLSSFFFHRFDFSNGVRKKKKQKDLIQKKEGFSMMPSGISRASMPPVNFDYSMFPFIKTELLLLVRQGNKWLWLLNIGLSLSMLFAPLTVASSYLLPALWFLQVTRWSDLVTKEKSNRVHYFTYAAYKPLQRMLPAQIIAGFLLAIGLSLPLILRYVIALNGLAILNIVAGALLVVLLAVSTGILSGGKKLFEVFFFLLTYMLINKLPAADYLGVMPQHHTLVYTSVLVSIVFLLAMISFVARSYQTKHL
ncbi:hypothetical protein KHS38_06815 [Mucilaginibacter sp. Bleaf8]|uniref:hypothetical protein n=1 Tax=Mucilaginibacter sp. Bleaf8 TaxID=2834430 RepID=UPI001BCF97D2|nr:hypothetical protein [Mucilaginibacter sp. Bleaf8]MBS7564114.1 hypothetical protein [Mucilaginibacter sp. Bleaf8]